MSHSVSWHVIAEILDQNDDYESVREALERHAPKPAYPEHLLGLWVKHPELGEVVCIWDKPGSAGDVLVRWRNPEGGLGVKSEYVPVSELKFPHQATKPEDVPVGEAWLVNVNDASCSAKHVVALKFDANDWRTGDGVVCGQAWWLDEEVTLVEPLVPARPEPQPEHPRTLSSVQDYEAAPEGAVVAASDNSPWVKSFDDRWRTAWAASRMTNSGMAERGEKDVLRCGWGNE